MENIDEAEETHKRCGFDETALVVLWGNVATSPGRLLAVTGRGREKRKKENEPQRCGLPFGLPPATLGLLCSRMRSAGTPIRARV